MHLGGLEGIWIFSSISESHVFRDKPNSFVLVMGFLFCFSFFNTTNSFLVLRGCWGWSESQPQGGEPSTSLRITSDSHVSFFPRLPPQTLLLCCCFSEVFNICVASFIFFLNQFSAGTGAGNGFSPFQFTFSSLFAMMTVKTFF